MTTFKKYALSESQLVQIARLCNQEQGCLDGCRAEASQGANLLETNATYRKKYGIDIYSFFRHSGWYYKAAYFMDNGSASASQIAAVRDVLVNGNRFFPQYVDEHDCLSDIKSISTGSVYNKSDYIKNKTIIKNKMGSTYTFYCFPAPGCDPFGYTTEAYLYVKQHGGGDDPAPEPVIERVSVSTKLREIERGDEGGCVRIWQEIIGTGVDGIFGPKTQAMTAKWQSDHGLTADGIVGRKTWAKALESLD